MFFRLEEFDREAWAGISARGFFALRDFPGAREELEEILSVDPTSSEAKQLLQSVHDATRTELHEQSDAALERGDYDRARRILEGHLRENPDDREIQSRLKRVFELQDEVSRLDATIIKKRADKLATTYAQAVAAKKRGELDRALELASSVLPQAGPDSEVARLVSTLERALAERRQQDAGLREAREPSRAGLHKEAGGRATRVYPGKREDGRRQQLDQLLKDATKLQRAAMRRALSHARRRSRSSSPRTRPPPSSFAPSITRESADTSRKNRKSKNSSNTRPTPNHPATSRPRSS